MKEIKPDIEIEKLHCRKMTTKKKKKKGAKIRKMIKLNKNLFRLQKKTQLIFLTA